MATLDGQKAMNKMLTWKTYKTGMCLNAVWNAFGAFATNGRYPLARNAYEAARKAGRIRTDRNPPAGAVVFWTNTKYPSAAGHIAISTGGNGIVSTDKPGVGKVGRSTISAIEASWGGRTYVGWSDWFMGSTISNLGKLPTGSTSANTGSKITVVDGVWGGQTTRALQVALGVTVDGGFGPQTIKALQKKLGQVADGKFGSQTKKALQKQVGVAQDANFGKVSVKALQNKLKAGNLFGAATKPSSSAGKVAVDGKFGSQTIKAIQKKLGQKQDGSFGPVTKKALQRKLNVVADGNFGSVSIKALQRKVGATVDGSWGSQTTKKLQTALNNGSF